MEMNNRRKLLFAFGAGVLAAPTRLLAQRVYRIAVLIHGSERGWTARYDALRAGLRALGYVEGKNLSLSVRWNEGGLERLPDLAAELLRDKPDVFVGYPVLSAAAIHKHTKTVPIVIASGSGAVKIGLAQSLARPGGSVTGVESQMEDLTPKHLELLKTIVPAISRVGMLNTGKFNYHDEAMRAAAQAAKVLKLTLVDLRVDAPSDLARIASTCGKGGLRRAVRDARSESSQLARANHRTGRAAASACDLCPARIHARGRPDQLFPGHRGHVPPRCHARRQNIERRQAGRPAD
jgi:putative ABC transport system substrate-binding protein